MSKLLLFTLVVLLASTLISAAATSKETCGKHGDPCTQGCCQNMRCHPYANRCQVIITEEDLMAQREKILGRRGKDYK